MFYVTSSHIIITDLHGAFEQVSQEEERLAEEEEKLLKVSAPQPLSCSEEEPEPPPEPEQKFAEGGGGRRRGRREEVEVAAEGGRREGQREGREVASALQEPPEGWRGAFGVQQRGGRCDGEGGRGRAGQGGAGQEGGKGGAQVLQLRGAWAHRTRLHQAARRTHRGRGRGRCREELYAASVILLPQGQSQASGRVRGLCRDGWDGFQVGSRSLFPDTGKGRLPPGNPAQHPLIPS